MSGPKVVRIVTREEVLSICAGLLARVEAALADWVRVGLRNDCVSTEEVAASKARVEALRALLVADRFLDVQKRAPQEIASLQEDMQTRLMRKAEEASTRRLMERRRTEATATLLKTLTVRGKYVPAELEERLNSSDKDLAAKAMTEALGLLTEAPQGAEDHKRALATRLKDEETSTSLANWLATQPTAPADVALHRLERQISELATLGSDRLVLFEERLRKAGNEVGARRNMLLDSLQLDLSRELANQRDSVRMNQDFAMALAELRSLGVGDEVVSPLVSARASDRQAHLATIRAEIGTRRSRMAAEARRTAVLKSLAGLGYEVTEGLQTAWAKDGRVVVRKAAPPGYGVEISGSPDVGRMQVRVVAFDGEVPVDAARDRDAESLWCGDVTELERQLARDGGALVIERALPVGATPVKRVAGRAQESSGVALAGSPAQTRALR